MFSVLNDGADSYPQDQVFKDLYDRGCAPPHPGEILREDIVPLLGLTRAALARALAISPRRLRDLLAERTPVTADLAIRLGTALGHGPRYWLGVQMHHDVWLIAQPHAHGIKPLQWTRAAPRTTVSARSAHYR